jgi:hypothetical protein
LENQSVDVTGTIPYDDILAKIKKTGKEVNHKYLHPHLLIYVHSFQVKSGTIVE